jgi:hypothetical protein
MHGFPHGIGFVPPPDDTKNDMPVALIFFGDKSHTDLHGAIALTPIIFTLTLFNRTSQNNANFLRPLACTPNLIYGKNNADKLLLTIKSNTNISVFLLHLNQLDRSIKMVSYGHQCWAGMLT